MRAATAGPALLRAAARALPGRVVALHLAGAVLLLAATVRAHDDDGTAVLVLRGVAVLLAAALALSVDEREAALLDASPTPFAHRVGTRLAVGCALVAPAWGLALAAVAAGGARVPAAALTLELLALTAVGLALPAVLRRERRLPETGAITGPVLLGALLAAGHLPRELSLLPVPLDPSWDAAHARWAAVLAVGVAVLLAGLAEPATAGRGRLRHRLTSGRLTSGRLTHGRPAGGRPARGRPEGRPSGRQPSEEQPVVTA